MNPDDRYVSTSKDKTCAHVDPHCHGLQSAVKVKPIPRTAAAGLPECSRCAIIEFDRKDDPAPATVPCPCGSGEADRKQPIFDTLRSDRRKRAVQWNYRHAGCWIGGTIVTVNDHVHTRVGPLFEPGRYGVGRGYAPPEASEPAEEVLAD